MEENKEGHIQCRVCVCEIKNHHGYLLGILLSFFFFFNILMKMGPKSVAQNNFLCEVVVGAFSVSISLQQLYIQ